MPAELKTAGLASVEMTFSAWDLRVQSSSQSCLYSGDLIQSHTCTARVLARFRNVVMFASSGMSFSLFQYQSPFDTSFAGMGLAGPTVSYPYGSLTQAWSRTRYLTAFP